MKHYFIFLLLSLSSIVGLKAQNSTLLTGTPISSSNVLTKASYAFDNNLSSYYKSKDASYSWIGLDLGKAHVITQIEYVPGVENMQTAIFEGANDPSFVDAVPLNIIKEKTASLVTYKADVNVSKGFRYVRFQGAHGQYGVAIELKFYGYEGTGTDNQFYSLTNLPTIVINTNDKKDILSQDYRGGNIKVIDENGKLSHVDSLEVRGRGNASWTFDKKGFRIKMNKKATLLDATAKSKNWTLIAAYPDRSLIRSLLAFDLSKKMELYYTPYCRGVDLVVNGEYRGTYMLCDQIEVKKNRVDINEMSPENINLPDVAGDYLIEIDSYANKELPLAHFYSRKTQIPVTIKSPKDDKIVSQQNAYIKDHFSKMEEALYASSYLDSLNGYQKYLDKESFAKYFLLEELTGNNDAFQSVYMIKKKGDDRFYTGPAWDFDWSFQNLIWNLFPTRLNDQADYWNLTKNQSIKPMNDFLKRIMSDPAMRAEIKKIWIDNRSTKGLTHEYLNSLINKYADLLSESRALNFVRWTADVPSSYNNEISQLKDYALKRITFIDNRISTNNPIINGVYRLRLASTDGHYLRTSNNKIYVDNADNSNKAAIEDWFLVPTGSYYTIRPVNTHGQAVTISGTNENTTLYLSSLNTNSATQLWSLVRDYRGLYSLISKQNGLALSTSDYSKFNLTSYVGESSHCWDLSYAKLYLVGDATSAGWDITKVISLPKVDGAEGIFEWVGILNPGTFKFQLTRSTTWSPSVNALSANTLVENGSYPLLVHDDYKDDHKFKVSTKSIYSMRIDMNKLQMEVKKENLISNAIINANYCIRLSGSDDALAYSYNNNSTNLIVDDYKNSRKDWYIVPSGSYYSIRPIGSAGQAITVSGSNAIISNYTGANTQLWNIFKKEDGTFVVMSVSNSKFLKVYDNAISFESYENAQPFDFNFSKLYLVGDATSAGWDINKIISLPLYEDQPGVFVWNGVLNPGSFRFQLTRNTSWVPIVNSLTYMEPIEEENNLEINTASKSGYRFVIGEKDTYTIVADLNNLKMTISRPLSYATRSIEIGDISKDNKFTAVASNHSVEIKTNNRVDLVRLFNLRGTLIDSTKYAEGTFYIGNNLPSGVYVVEFVHQGQSEQRKVVIK